MKLSKQFTRREKILMVLLAVLLLAGGYFRLIHLPVTVALSDIAARQTEADGQIIVLEVKLQKLTEMRAELERIRSDPALVSIPDYDNLQRVMVFLNMTLAAAADYDLSFQQVELPTEGQVVRRTIDMTFQCASYNTARAVIGALHASPYRCQLGGLSILPAANVDGAERSDDLTMGPVSVSLSVTFFELKA